MTTSNLLINQNQKVIEVPNLYQDLNVLLAELVGWQNLNVQNDTVLVSQKNQTPQKFDFFDDKVISPIAQKYHKKASKINELEWSCEYLAKGEKAMMIVSEQKELALAMAIVLEFCI